MLCLSLCTAAAVAPSLWLCAQPQASNPMESMADMTGWLGGGPGDGHAMGRPLHPIHRYEVGFLFPVRRAESLYINYNFS